MNIDPLSQLSIAPEESGASQSLGRDEFLKMLIAQLENQDPINPQDASEFSAQLAQFSSLEQLVTISEGLGDVADAQRSFSNTLQGLASTELIGRGVVAASDHFEMTGGSFASTPAFELDTTASSVTIEFFSDQDRSLGSFDLGPFEPGFNEVPASVLSEADLGDGVYRFRLEARAGDEVLETRSFVQGRVSGAIPTGDQTFVEIGGLVLPYSVITEITK